MLLRSNKDVVHFSLRNPYGAPASSRQSLPVFIDVDVSY